MRGTVLNLWGGNSALTGITPLAGLDPNEILTLSTQEWTFWQWRCNALAFTANLTFDGGAFVENGTTVSTKETANDNEKDLLFGNTGYSTSAGGIEGWNTNIMNDYFRLEPSGLWSNRILFSALAISGLDDYFLRNFPQVGFTASAAVLILRGTDLHLGRSYEQTVTLYEDPAKPWGGEFVIEPSSFYTWSRDGVDTYDAATGALV
jgi:hypothetical protein